MTRTPSDSDGRVVHVALTEEGRALIDQTLPDHMDTEDRLLAALTPGQRKALADTLRVLLKSFGDTTGPDPSDLVKDARLPRPKARRATPRPRRNPGR